MTDSQPRNLFTTTTFLSLVSSLLIASTPNIGDIVRNGGTIEKYLYLFASVLSGAGVAAEKMKNEPNIYTPNWEPFGKDKSQVIAQTINLPLAIEAPQVSPVPVPPPIKNEPSSDTVQTIINDAQTVVSIAQNPLNLLKLL